MINLQLKRVIHIFLAALLLLPLSGLVYSEDVLRVVRVLHFQKPYLSGWNVKEFEGQTSYNMLEEDNRPAIKAVSLGSASAFYKELEVDIRETPYLTWSWKVVEAPQNSIEKVKAGDDFPARVYIIVKDGIFPWQTKAINYVWAMTEEKDSTWPNPFTSNVMMKAVTSGSEELGMWKTYKVNVYEDLKMLFGKDFHKINGVAIMTDMDNTGKSASAFYGEVTFVER